MKKKTIMKQRISKKNERNINLQEGTNQKHKCDKTESEEREQKSERKKMNKRERRRKN